MPAVHVTLAPATGDVRRRCEALAVHAAQQAFVAPVATYLAVCDADRIWTPLAVCVDGRVVGFAMWARDPAEEGSLWLGAILVDRAHQRRGVGRAAVERLVERLAGEPDCREIALSYDPRNAVARRLYASLGFVETDERTDEGELVARRLLARPAAGG
jgi:diamine N-acetyltransferase